MGRHGFGSYHIASCNFPALTAADQAAASTACATWYLVYVTAALAILTFAVVCAALYVPSAERRYAAKRERSKFAARLDDARSAIRQAEIFIRGARDFLTPARIHETTELQHYLNRRATWTRLLEYYSRDDNHNPEVPHRIIVTLQALDELRDAFHGLLPGHRTIEGIEGEEEAAKIAERAVERLEKAKIEIAGGAIPSA